jgi:phytoene/squalene synthetase
VDLELFSRGGLRILQKIEAQDYDVFARRPAISRLERAGMLLKVLSRQFLFRAA